MPFIPKLPQVCRHLDMALVLQTLTKHRLDITAAARELGIRRTDLSQLTWHNPKLLEAAKEAIALHVCRCHSVMIQALYSPKRRRQEWAASKILASSMGSSSPFAPDLRPQPRPATRSTRPRSEFLIEADRQRALKRAAKKRSAGSQ
jgi:hypothetical protein